ncbi:MAG: hypothetical protein WCQ55_08970 [Paludibacteraceae bacterium]
MNIHYISGRNNLFVAKRRKYGTAFHRNALMLSFPSIPNFVDFFDKMMYRIKQDFSKTHRHRQS